jgi:hypothetical protein
MAETDIACDGTCSSPAEFLEQDRDSLRGRILSGLAVLPAVGLALLPKAVCPVCLAAYAGVLSSLGLGISQYAAYLIPVTVLFLVLSITTLIYGALKRDRYGPFVMGACAALIIIFGKFLFDSEVALYGGVVLLAAASIWNAWPGKAPSPSQRLNEARLWEALNTIQRRRKDDRQT